jgi:alpha-L-rhamnosidase
VLFICQFFLTTSSSSNKKDSDLKCEYGTNPIGMDVLSPQLSWQIESEKRGIIQSAYQIIVADYQ